VSRAYGGDQRRSSDDVGDRVPGAHFVESDVISGNAVHPPLRRCKMNEDRERVVAHGLFQIRVEEASPDLGPGPVVFISMCMDVARAGIMPMLLMPGQGSLDDKAAAAENAVVVGHETAFERENSRCCAYGGEHAFLMFGKRVEEGGNKHIARHASERIEVNPHWHPLPPLSRKSGPLRSEGFRIDKRCRTPSNKVTAATDPALTWINFDQRFSNPARLFRSAGMDWPSKNP